MDYLSPILSYLESAKPMILPQIPSMVAALGVGIATYFLLLTQHQANGLLEAFKVLASPDHRKARKTVYILVQKLSKK